MAIIRDCVLDVASQLGGAAPGVVTVYDKSRYHNDVTLNNVTWAQLSTGLWVLDFNGTNGFSTLAASPSLAIVGDMTIELWIRADATQADASGSIFRGQNPYILWHQNTGQLKYQFRDEVAGTWRAWTTTAAIPDLTWIHLVVTRAVAVNSQMNIYINGVPFENQLLLGYPGATTVAYRIGGYAVATERFKGEIALHKAYPFLLTPAQIRARYHSEKWLFGVPV